MHRIPNAVRGFSFDKPILDQVVQRLAHVVDGPIRCPSVAAFLACCLALQAITPLAIETNRLPSATTTAMTANFSVMVMAACIL